MPPEWIDYNGHMMDAYYFMAFTEATEAFLDHVGLGAAYRARTGSGIYTAESHLCFLSSIAPGAVLAYQTQLLGHDAKRLHVFHQMSYAGTVAATCELMFLHVSGERVAPMPPEAATVVAALAAEHAALPRPDRAGRRVAMPQRVLTCGCCALALRTGLARRSYVRVLARGSMWPRQLTSHLREHFIERLDPRGMPGSGPHPRPKHNINTAKPGPGQPKIGEPSPARVSRRGCNTSL